MAGYQCRGLWNAPTTEKGVFLGYHKNTALFNKLKKERGSPTWLQKTGVLAQAFPVANSLERQDRFVLKGSLPAISKKFNHNGKISPFLNTGYFQNGTVVTAKTNASYDGPRMILADILEKGPIAKEFFIPEDQIHKWEYLKGAKKETRKTKEGFSYSYNEGSMGFPDALDKASRTIITGEGGPSPSRFKHVVSTSKGSED